ncbi:unnamed protein product [Protopolystoma xenopodis]|uniref:CBM21 domain-containing protein n=1 Tax=Protopolystoma xenopodis TaxID=117903 RepID=A0A3S4ZMZ2_9PLAT|nr:unnamed protein product [Protopolystoma xenopodis]
MPADGLEAVELVGKAEPDNEYQYYKPKRSSSLKSARTPPDTPARKAVRFADVFGLDLTTVKTVFDHDAPPKIPASAMQDLRLDSDLSLSSIGAKHYRLCFAQPGASPSFMTRVLAQTVSLESADIDQTRNMLTGTVRVKSFGFEKHIFIRITFNNWQTHSETSAAYVQGSHDGMTDRFSFSIVFPVCMVAGEQAQFAIRYETHTGLLFWDNNYGQNYVVTCYAKHTDMGGDGSWIHYI